MSFTRTLTTRAVAPLSRTAVFAPVSAASLATRARFVSNKPFEKDDLGGPGGQDPVPKNPNRTDPLYAIGAVGLLFGGALYFMAFRPSQAQKLKEDVNKNIGEAKEKTKEAAKDAYDAAKGGK